MNISIRWPGIRRATVVVSCVALGLSLAACSGSNAASPPAHHTPSPSVQPTSGPGAVAAIKSDWVALFNGTLPISHRLTLLQNGSQFASFVNKEAKTSVGSLVLEASAKVGSVTLQSPSQAKVVYTILLGGRPLESNLTGTAVYDGGKWKVATATFCGLLQLAYGSNSKSMPAVCGS